MISKNVYFISIILAVCIAFVLFSGKGTENSHRRQNYNDQIEQNRDAFDTPRVTVYPSNTDINSQYSNPHLTLDKHPVLAYQYAHSKGINPANIGDPIRVHNIGGGASGLYGSTGAPLFSNSLLFSQGSIPTGLQPKGRDEDMIAGPGNNGYISRREAYSGEEGPYPGKMQNIPVPANSLKFSNEQYNPDMFRFSPLARGTIGSAIPTGYHRPLGNVTGMSEYVAPPGTDLQTGRSGGLSDLPQQTRPLYSGDFYRPYGPNVPVSNVPFIGSVNAYAPFPEVINPWEKSGILTAPGSERSGGKEDQILNLYRRPIAPLQDLWEYQVQDKNGFVIKLNVKYLENGDVIPHITGKSGGPWTVHDYVQNKYIWV